MKLRSTLIITALLLCLANVAMGKGRVEFQIKTLENDIFALNLENPQNANVQIALRDLEGTTLHKELYTQSKVNLEYRLQDLPQGYYVLVLKYNDLIQLQPITVQHDSLLIDKEERKTIFPPHIMQSPGYLDIRMDCPSSLSVLMEISDDHGHILYRGPARSKGEIQKRFNLKRLEAGNYHFAMEIEDDVLTHRYTKLINLHLE